MNSRVVTKRFLSTLAFLCMLGISAMANAQQKNACWTLHSTLPAAKGNQPFWVNPVRFQVSELDVPALLADLQNAPREYSAQAKTQPFVLSLPGPSGEMERFTLEEYSMMAPELAEEFPTIKTYKGVGVDDPTANIRADWTEQGFHAAIISAKGSWYIDPLYKLDANYYASYNRRDLQTPFAWECHTSNTVELNRTINAGKSPRAISGASLRTYRLACAATGEYSAFHGGTTALAQSAIVTAVNRVNQIYESEVSVRMQLVANNNLLIYLNAGSDPYSNNNGSTMLSQNQANITTVIGSANYDIGHVFSTGGGGIAALNSVCANSIKARGVTGSNSPVSDAFYVDYVAHEIGHQFGANHTFNSTSWSCGGGNRNASTAYEPGSGSTIMAYAGICSPDDLQWNSDPYFHSVSIEEILAFISGDGNSCAVVTATGNNPPTVNAGPDRTIPKHTPFSLTATANDVDNNTITYSWEERALGVSTLLTSADNGSSPNYRVFNPSSNQTRDLPRLSSLLDSFIPSSEKWYDVARTVTYMVTARDGLGGLQTDTMQLTVSGSAGPFEVTFPNTAGTHGGTINVTWNVAGTASAPVSTSNVNILLSTDGGVTYNTTLATNTPNDGSESVTLPNLNVAQARVKIQAVGNIFWDISNSNFAITTVAQVDDWSLYAE